MHHFVALSFLGGRKYFCHIGVPEELLWGIGRLPLLNTSHPDSFPPATHPRLPKRERTAATMVLSQRQRDELWVPQCQCCFIAYVNKARVDMQANMSGSIQHSAFVCACSSSLKVSPQNEEVATVLSLPNTRLLLTLCQFWEKRPATSELPQLSFELNHRPNSHTRWFPPYTAAHTCL